MARWAKAEGLDGKTMSETKNTPTAREAQKKKTDVSDRALAALLRRLKATLDPIEIRQLSEQIERIVFHKQYTNA